MQFTNLEKKNIAKFWGSYQSNNDIDFFSFQPVRQYLYECVSGDTQNNVQGDWIQKWCLKRYLYSMIPVQHCLSLCCGFGGKEINLSGLGVFNHCTALDISKSAIKEAKKSVQKAGVDNIDFIVAD